MPYCSNCGNKLEEDAKFCSKCGMAVDSNIALQRREPSRKVKRKTLSIPAIFAIVIASIVIVGLLLTVL
jgi:uncharacterized membrane protein YvbJ